MKALSPTDLLSIENISRWREHPASMVRELFGVEPDAWQEEALEIFPHNQREALKACKGPGKTTVLAWLAWNFLLTRPYPKVIATSINKDNLMDGLWTEMAKWQARSPLLERAFEWTKTRIFNKEHPEQWFMTARTWSRSADRDQQANTLAGLHADYILFILDEVGGIPDAVMAAAEAALASGIEQHILIAGNPTHLEGPLYRACSTEKRLWKVIEITGDPDDPNRSPRVSEKWAREQIEKYGRDNPWVLVNVFGKFPPSSLNALIGPDEANEAMKRYYRPDQIGNSALVFGVDVARFGNAASVIRPRRGIQCYPQKKLRGVNSTQGAGTVARMWDDQQADAVFIDSTGGFGAGWIDQLGLLGKAPIGVGFATQAHDMARYANKRAEMAFDAVQWIKDGGALTDDAAEIVAVAVATTYTFSGDKLLLEPKESIELKVGYTLDDFDAFILTFAEPVSPKPMIGGHRRQNVAATEWNPFAQAGGSLASAVDASYAPFRNR